MYILQNALENLLRNKGRNILIAAIIFAIVTTTVVALIINNTAAAVIEHQKELFGSEVYINPDFEKIREEAMENSTDGRMGIRIPQIEPELALVLAESAALQKTEATGSMSAYAENITAIDQSEGEDPGQGNSGFAAGGGMMLVSGAGNYRIIGDDWNDFAEGTLTRRLFDDGVSAFPQADNECLISRELAELNNVSVGGVIDLTVEFSYEIPMDEDLEAYEDGDSYRAPSGLEYTLQKNDMMSRATRTVPLALTVTGVYEDLNDEYPNENMSGMAGLNRRNEILTTLNTLLVPRGPDETGARLSTTYFLKSPDRLEEFEQYARSAGLPDTFTVSTDENGYNTVVKPVESLQGISVTFMIVVLVMGAIILLLLTSIAIRERKYEIGVLRAMGLKKRKVSLGLWTELLAVTLACLILGLGVGAVTAQPVANALIEGQVAALEEENGGMPGRGGGMGMMTTGRGPGGPAMIGGGMMGGAEPLSELHITIGLDTILEILALALLLATLAGLFSISKITKYEPIKILMDRN